MVGEFATPSVTYIARRFALVTAILVGTLFALASPASAHDFGPCTIDLYPGYDENPLGAPHTFTAYVTQRGGNENITAGDQCAQGGGGPAEGKIVTFTVISGPNAGLSGTSVTGADGKASVVYTSLIPGIDVVEAKVSELSCYTQLNYDNQDLSDCPPGEVFTLTITDTASKKWYKPGPYEPENPYDPENPYYCEDGQYYNYGDYCADSVHSKGKKWVGFNFSKKCKKKNFSFRPAYSGGTVLWSKTTIGKKKIAKLETAPFKFKVPVKKYKKGATKTLKLTTIFTDGTPVVLKAKFKRCK